MAVRPRRLFSTQFKGRTIALIRSSGKSVRQVCRELDLTETTVRRWLAQAEVVVVPRADLTMAERAELARLRNEVRTLREDQKILKEAVAVFARETTR